MVKFVAKSRGRTKSITVARRKMGTRKYARVPRRTIGLRNKTSVSTGLGFPKRMNMVHRYTGQIDLTSVTGLIAKYQYSANGLYDPNITGGGHQPSYFDPMTGLYNHYTVIGSKISVIVTPLTATEPGMYAGIYIDDDTTTSNITDITVLAEQSSGTWRQIAPNANNTYRFTKKWSAKKTFGGSILGNDQLQGSAAANPVEQSYYTIALQGFGVTNASARVTVQITYIAVWDELKDMPQS